MDLEKLRFRRGDQDPWLERRYQITLSEDYWEKYKLTERE